MSEPVFELRGVEVRYAGRTVLTVDNLSINAVPEPGSLALLGLAMLGMCAVRGRKSKQ